MSINLRFPNIIGATEKEQIIQIKSYLHQLVQELNWALSNQEPVQTTGTPQETVSEGIIDEMKTLVLQATNALNQYYEKINGVLEANYLKKEAFNAYKDEVSQLIEDLAGEYLTQDDLNAYKLEVEQALEGLAEVYVAQADLEEYQKQVAKDFEDLADTYASKTSFLAHVQETEQTIGGLVPKVDFEAYQQSMEQTIGGLVLNTDFDGYKQTNDQAVADLQQEVETLRQMIEEITGGE